MQVPSLIEIVQLMERYTMLENIRRHSLKVARLAEHLHRMLEVSVPDKDLPRRDLVIAGALLHDIAKTACISSGNNHAQEGAAICQEHGLPELAEIVGGHVFMEEQDMQRLEEGIFTARELVYYADKRVLHHHIVSLEERLDYVMEKYGQQNVTFHERITINFNRCAILEQAICTTLDLPPAALTAE